MAHRKFGRSREVVAGSGSLTLLPAVLSLLGDWNWYLPSVLRWLPDMRVEVPEWLSGSLPGGGMGLRKGDQAQ